MLKTIGIGKIIRIRSVTMFSIPGKDFGVSESAVESWRGSNHRLHIFGSLRFYNQLHRIVVSQKITIDVIKVKLTRR